MEIRRIEGMITKLSQNGLPFLACQWHWIAALDEATTSLTTFLNVAVLLSPPLLPPPGQGPCAHLVHGLEEQEPASARLQH